MKLIIITEELTGDEIKNGKPFSVSNYPNDFFLHKLACAGIQLNDCYFTALFKTYPKLPDEEAFSLLKEELSALKANLVLLLGQKVFSLFTGELNLSAWRGSLLRNPLSCSEKMLATLHPYIVSRADLPSGFFLLADLKRAKKEMLFPELLLPKRKLLLDLNFTDTILALQEIKTWQFVSVDIENLVPSGVITEIGLGNTGTEAEKSFAMTIQMYSIKGGARWKPEQEVQIWLLLREILTSEKIFKILQNASHDMTLLYEWVGEIYPLYSDTMIAAHLAYCEQPKDLGSLASIYTDEPHHKSDRNALSYNALDVATTYEIAFQIEKEELSSSLKHFLHGFQMPLFSLYWRASMKGIKVDNKRRLMYLDEAVEIRDTLQKNLNQLLGFELNVKSPKAMIDFLYQKLKLPIQKTKDKVSTDSNAIEYLMKKSSHPALPLIAEIREQRTMISSFLSQKAQDPDERIRCHWKITGTETGRLSSSSNSFGTGCNLQNIPKRFRDMFIPDDGFCFVIGDMSQVEARFVAWLSEDEAYKELFQTNQDVHKQVASWIFKKPLSEVTKAERQKAKASAHGAPYGISYKKVAQLYDMPNQEADWLIKQYFYMFPKVRTHFQDAIQKKLSQGRTLFNVYGRKRVFFGWWNEELFRQAYAHVPQGSAADHINLAAIRLSNRFPKEAEATILLQIHDELVIQCKEPYANEIAQLFKEEVERPILVNNDFMSIPLDVRIGKTWHEKDGIAWKEPAKIG